MAVLDSPPEGYPPEIIGYVEPWIASPGDTVQVKISSTEPELSYRLVRMIHGPQGTDTSGMKQEVVKAVSSGRVKARYQVAHPGSYAIIDKVKVESFPASAGVQAGIYFQSHLPEAGHAQTIMSTLDVSNGTGFAVVLNTEGVLDFWIGVGEKVETLSTGFYAKSKRWTKLRFTLKDSFLEYDLEPQPDMTDIPPSAVRETRRLTGNINLSHPFRILFAAGFAESPERSSTHATNHFNGRLDSPSIAPIGAHMDAWAPLQWDFSREIPSDSILEKAGTETRAGGRLVNAPTRAVTGHDWDGMESDWTKASRGYGAIHFHEDDLDDAGWETDFSITLPESLRSGVYAVELEATNGRETDTVPFFVRATPKSTAAMGAKVAYIMSTFTYLAYANEHVYDRMHLKDKPNTVWTIKPDKHAKTTARRNDLGLSCYDIYNDRSGVIFSTAKRPILNMRPEYVSWNFHRLRGLSADVLMIEYLERCGIPYDIVCDHDLHSCPGTALRAYGTIITGSHPEYHTNESLGAYASFIKAGGNVMYLGGNGFYWSCAVPPRQSHRVEIRRGGEGIRPFICDGGDRIFSSNGQSGLLWRSRGMPANRLFGVGTCAKGTGPGVPYQRTEASKDASFAWMFEGIAEEELLGEHGFGGGASGDEIDKCDYGIGSPHNTIVLATSIPHSAEFGMFPEDLVFPYQSVLGPQTREVRSDMIYYETSGGGAVFSVGSMNWLCSLGWNHFDNNIARLTGNVLSEFIRRHK